MEGERGREEFWLGEQHLSRQQIFIEYLLCAESEAMKKGEEAQWAGAKGWEGKWDEFMWKVEAGARPFRTLEGREGSGAFFWE